MEDKDYEQKKRECWEKFFKENRFDLYDITARSIFNYAFNCGYNLSKHDNDAEQEEMLSVSRRRVQELYNRYFGNPLEPISKIRLRKDIQDLFGSKCLPIEEDQKSAKPKFKVGDKVRISCAYKNGEIWDKIIHGRVATIKSIYRNATNNYFWTYQFEEGIRDFSEGWLSLYTDKEYEKDNLQTIDDRRLNIAAMILSGLLASGKYKHPVKRALELTESLIAEGRKGSRPNSPIN